MFMDWLFRGMRMTGLVEDDLLANTEKTHIPTVGKPGGVKRQKARKNQKAARRKNRN